MPPSVPHDSHLISVSTSASHLGERFHPRFLIALPYSPSLYHLRGGWGIKSVGDFKQGSQVDASDSDKVEVFSPIPFPTIRR